MVRLLGQATLHMDIARLVPAAVPFFQVDPGQGRRAARPRYELPLARPAPQRCALSSF
jgi:hypothetical protein